MTSSLDPDSGDAIRLRAVRKTFHDPGRGEVRALDDIDLDIGPGITALLGANGAGKTTLLRCLATLMTPDAGTITLAGHDVANDGAAVRATIGFVALTTRLPPRLSVREVLQLAGDLHGMDRSHLARRIDAIRERFALADILHQRCGGLSTGQSQRANLARAMIHEPPILIFDEPTTGLDIAAAQRLIDLLADLKDDRRTMLLCTHDLHEVDALADRILVMRAGRVVADHPRSELPDHAALAACVSAHLDEDAA